MKQKTTAGLLGIFLGGLGAHKFYLGQTGWGIVYLLFCWTYIPGVIGLIEGIIYLATSDNDFDRIYNPGLVRDAVGAPALMTTSPTKKQFTFTIDSSGSQHRQTPGPTTVQGAEWARRRPVSPDEQERWILQYARQQQGRISVADVMAEMTLSYDEIQTTLEKLRKLQLCDLQVDMDSGVVTYEFPSFRPRTATPTPQARLDGTDDTTVDLDLR